MKYDWNQVDYRIVSDRKGEYCGNCSMKRFGMRCTAVKGPIFITGWCRLWAKIKGGKRKDGRS